MFDDLFDFEGTAGKSDEAIRALQAVQASAKKKKHEAFLLRVMSAALETAADDELDRMKRAADDLTDFALGGLDVSFQTPREGLFEEVLED